MKEDITLTDLIDVKMLQKIQDAFANATGMAALTVDLDGAVTNLSNPTEFCMELTRGCPKGAERCNACDLKGGEDSGRTGRPAVYYCHGGLMDFAAPILLDGKQIGSLIGGQVLPEPPDENKFRRIARELGIDENRYVKAVKKIRIVPKKQIEASAELLYVMANALSDMGYQKYQTRLLAQELSQVAADMTNKVHSVSKSITEIDSKNGALRKNMEELLHTTKDSREAVEKTNQIIKYINEVSMQTKLLGFNASVEASRSGKYGSGFGVIAQEIRRLADNSQEQFGKIDKIIQSVKTTIFAIDEELAETGSMVSESTSLLTEAAEVMKEIKEYAYRLDQIGKKL